MNFPKIFKLYLKVSPLLLRRRTLPFLPFQLSPHTLLSYPLPFPSPLLTPLLNLLLFLTFLPWILFTPYYNTFPIVFVNSILFTHIFLPFLSLFLLLFEFVLFEKVDVVNFGLKVDIIEDVGEDLIMVNILIE